MGDSTAEAIFTLRFGILSSVAFLVFSILRSQFVISIIVWFNCNGFLDNEKLLPASHFDTQGGNSIKQQFRIPLRDAYLGISSVHPTQRLANFSYRRIRTDCIHDVRYRVRR